MKIEDKFITDACEKLQNLKFKTDDNNQNKIIQETFSNYEKILDNYTLMFKKFKEQQTIIRDMNNSNPDNQETANLFNKFKNKIINESNNNLNKKNKLDFYDVFMDNFKSHLKGYLDIETFDNLRKINYVKLDEKSIKNNLGEKFDKMKNIIKVQLIKKIGEENFKNVKTFDELFSLALELCIKMNYYRSNNLSFIFEPLKEPKEYNTKEYDSTTTYIVDKIISPGIQDYYYVYTNFIVLYQN